MYVKQGRVKGLAIDSSRRSELFPGLPTVAESGLPGFESVSPQTIVAPARTPAGIVTRLNHEIVRVLNGSDVKERLKNLGIEVVGSSPEELAASIKTEMARVGKLIKAAGIREE
jgi:tripartite-type tricarboxylate transporter receptor subunit TctC